MQAVLLTVVFVSYFSSINPTSPISTINFRSNTIYGNIKQDSTQNRDIILSNLDTTDILKDSSSHKPDTFSKEISDTIYNPLTNSRYKFIRPDTLSNRTINEDLYTTNDVYKIDSLVNLIEKIFEGIIISVFILVFLIIIHRIYILSNKTKRLENEVRSLNKIVNDKYEEIKCLIISKPIDTNRNSTEIIKVEEERENNRKQFITTIDAENLLSENEITFLTSKIENRWIVLGHSATGKAHSKSLPPIRCQDSNYFEIIDNNWVMSIVCDGAGSAKHSDIGSNYLAKKALPKNLLMEIFKSKWYQEFTFPNEEEWNQLIILVFKNSLDDLIEWIHNSEYKDINVKEFASTVILTMNNNSGILVGNIGDGRGGYLNRKGELKSLFDPYKGEESNSTVFITSPIWDKPDLYIKTRVVVDENISVFILSDGLEKISFNCSQLIQGIWIDPNIPYRDFFLPIFKTLKNIPKEQESRLIKDWEKLLEEGNEKIKNENDDKTMVLSFLK